MGKKKSRATQTSKGEVGSPMKTKLRSSDEGYASQRMMNQLNAFNKGKRVMVTIKNPNGAETNKPYIRVPAKDIWRSSKR
mgnify:CR=1 FL=1